MKILFAETTSAKRYNNIGLPYGDVFFILFIFSNTDLFFMLRNSTAFVCVNVLGRQEEHLKPFAHPKGSAFTVHFQ
jgi:hypothetical protein